MRGIGLDPDEQRTPVEEVALERLRKGGFPSKSLLDDAPQAKVSVFGRESGAASAQPYDEFKPLSALVRCNDDAVRAVMEDWLSGCYAAEGVPRLRQIAGEFSSFASSPTAKRARVDMPSPGRRCAS